MSTVSASRSETGRVTLFGKLPSALDYVRINHSTPEAIALDQWLQAALQQLAERAIAWPTGHTRFALQPKGCASQVVGVITPSRDRAGRKFPLALFAPLPMSRPRGSSAALPCGVERFLSAAEELLATAKDLPAVECAPLLARLPAPSTRELEEAEASLADELRRLSVRDFMARLSTPALEGEGASFLPSVLPALTELRERGTVRPLVLDCPAATTLDVAVWSALTEHALPHQEPCFLFWNTSDSCRRLLVGTGAPPPSVPLWLAQPAARSDRLRAVFSTAAARETPTAVAGDSDQTPADQTMQQLLARALEAVRAPAAR